MGGIGSGRRGGCAKPTVEGKRCLTMTSLIKAGLFKAKEAKIQVTWAEDEYRAGGAIEAHWRDPWLELIYAASYGGNAPREIREAVFIERVSCHYGNTRPYFHCPKCDARRTKLYLFGPRFLCRKCYGLVYACQHEAPWDRAMRQANKIRRRLGVPEGWEGWAPPRKGAWRKKHDREIERAMELDEYSYSSFVQRHPLMKHLF